MITPLTIAVEAEAEADADAEEAAMWHERKKQNWGVEFLVEVGLTIRRVVELPEQYGRVYE